MNRMILASAVALGGATWAGGVTGAETTSTEFLTFHLMQIEQVIGGVNGDSDAQAIQLRMRSGGQQFVSEGVLIAWDAAGENPVELIDFPTDVANGSRGSTVLITTAAFDAATTPATNADFTMTNRIPDSYLDAGRITFEDDFGTIYWSLAWGGSNYTGSNAGAFTNDSNGDFGPPFPDPLPTADERALLFLGADNARSTRNIDDYAITIGSGVFKNNARSEFVVGDGPAFGFTVAGVCPGLIDLAWSGASEGGTVAIVFASNTGSVTIPIGMTCEGTQLGLGTRNIQLVRTVPGGANGMAMLSGDAPSFACGGFLQLLDIGTCATSSVAMIPN
ncbi:MAG: hypothetical protein ACF8PN_11285 [Phycisphaerales bacterium]